MNKFKLILESVDDEREEREFPTESHAIEYAKNWFLEGYRNDTINDDGRLSADKAAEALESDLRSGSEFYCGMFHERITLVRLS